MCKHQKAFPTVQELFSAVFSRELTETEHVFGRDVLYAEIVVSCPVCEGKIGLRLEMGWVQLVLHTDELTLCGVENEYDSGYCHRCGVMVKPTPRTIEELLLRVKEYAKEHGIKASNL